MKKRKPQTEIHKLDQTKYFRHANKKYRLFILFLSNIPLDEKGLQLQTAIGWDKKKKTHAFKSAQIPAIP